jgi:hypothetical protein
MVAEEPSAAVERGWRRVRLLRRRLLGLGGGDGPRPGADDAGLLPEVSGGYPIGPLRGLAVATVPPEWLDPLAMAGVPLAPAGPWQWGVHLLPAALAAPRRQGAAVLLPTRERLAACTGLELRPLRLAVAEACGCRLQAAPGVQLFVWDALAILVSCRELPLGGFLTGPSCDSRAAIALEPGGIQLVSF